MTRVMSSAGEGRLWKAMFVGVFTGVFVLGVSFLSFGQEVIYAPDRDPNFPYYYAGMGYDRESMQNNLFGMAMDEPEKFKRIFNTFEPHGLDINWISKNEGEGSYLSLAIIARQWKIVPYLLSKGINVDHMDGEEYTALMHSAICGHLPTVGRLVLAGANMFVTQSGGGTALNAARYGQINNHCPEGDYEDVIDYIQTAMEIEDPEGTKRAAQPPEQEKEYKYAAIAYNKQAPFIRTIAKDLPYSSAFQAIESCNQISQQMGLKGEDCESAAVFSSGNCGVYALSGDHKAFGVGVSEYGTSEKLNKLRAAAEREALEQCQAKSNGVICNIKISDCQG